MTIFLLISYFFDYLVLLSQQIYSVVLLAFLFFDNTYLTHYFIVSLIRLRSSDITMPVFTE